MAEVSIVSEMLRLFRDGATSYQPKCRQTLEPETGDPQASLKNLQRIGLPVQTIFAGKNGCLVAFVDGEQYYAAGLSLHTPERRAALVEFAAANGFGPLDRLGPFYDGLPSDYTGPLPVIDEARPQVPGQWQPPAKRPG